ncbi:MAG: RDD family protein [Candidatus Caldarchaeum sp.]
MTEFEDAVEDIVEALNHRVRRLILKTVYDRVEVSYTDLLEVCKVGEGTLNFHLRRLKNLLDHTPKGTYILSERGRLAIRALQTMHESLQTSSAEQLAQMPRLSADIIALRIAAFIVDATIFFIFSGVFLDPLLWGSIIEIIAHLSEVPAGHPWLFHYEHIPIVGELVFRLIGTYAHIFFAVYVFVTVLEAYKGQTPGKYLMGIRVVKVDRTKISLIESAIRNGGKIFLLPLDLLIGVLFYRKRGYIRFFDFYTEAVVEKIR